MINLGPHTHFCGFVPFELIIQRIVKKMSGWIPAFLKPLRVTGALSYHIQNVGNVYGKGRSPKEVTQILGYITLIDDAIGELFTF